MATQTANWSTICGHAANGYVIDEEDDPNMLPDFAPRAANTEKGNGNLKEKIGGAEND